MHRLAVCAVFNLLFACFAMLLHAGEVTDTSASAHAAVQPVRLDEVTWTHGFWADRFQAVRDRSLLAMWEIMRGTRYKPYYQHFLIAAGDAEGDYHGAAWNDGDFYKFLEAVCAVYAVTKDPKLESILDQSMLKDPMDISIRRCSSASAMETRVRGRLWIRTTLKCTTWAI
jgi:hypothetical protein